MEIMKVQNGSILVRVLGILAVLAVGIALGFIYADRQAGVDQIFTADNETSASEAEILYWVAPMDPNYRRDKPGKSPMGMELVPVYADSGTDGDVPPDSIRIEPSVEHNLGVRVQEAGIRPLWRRIEATGYVGMDENSLNHIHLRTEGWVERLLVDAEGERVVEGQLLFEFYSPELVNAQMEFLQEQKRGDLRLLRASRVKLRALGMVDTEIDELAARGEEKQTVKVFAPRSGIITSLHVREGMFVKPEMEVMSLADLSSVWMQAEVFEAQADWVAEGQSAEARLGYMPGEVFSGQVDYVYPVLDPETRTLRVRLFFDNPGERLKPNMYAAVTIFGSTHQDALTIPRDALIRAEGNDRVIVALGEGRYRSQEVMTGIESGPWVEIIAGLEAGSMVVTSAQFLIDSEASLAGSLRRIESADSNQGEPPTATVFGSGRVEGVNSNEGWLIIRHGPIDALGWPGMTMQFDVTNEVNLARVQVGQSVHFSIRPDEQGVFMVDMIHLVDTDEEKVSGEGGGMDHD
jgi:Cu(I)/Ag(I) efflux system membrane fusion protein